MPARLAGAAALPLVLPLILAGCISSHQPMGPVQGAAHLQTDELIAPDGARLPLRSWLPDAGTPPWAVIVALHGMNDYSNAFDQAAHYWAAQGVATYAYDQRGFGASSKPGIWSDSDTMVADLNAAVDAAAADHPGVPVYVLGESMGGAVVAAALGPGAAGKEPPLARHIAGAILSAPAMWGRQSMNAFYGFTLWLAYNTVPGMALEPPRSLKIIPSDNIEMLRALGRDPLILKRTRVDMLVGLVDLMSRAENSADHLPPNLPLLVLFGRHEQILPKAVVTETLRRVQTLPPDAPLRIALYDNGYHMLLRDLQAETVWRDVVAWMRSPQAALPSGADRAYAQEHAPAQAGVAASDGKPGDPAVRPGGPVNTVRRLTPLAQPEP